MQPDRVGIVVLNYRGAGDTIACTESLHGLTTPAKIVVVDNGSGDDSIDRISDAAPDVELIANANNVGFGAGNNVAIERLIEAGVEFVWLLNNDTTVEPGTLAAMLDVADSDARLGAVGSVIYAMDRPAEVLTWGGGSLGRWSGRTRDARSPGDRVDYLTAASMLIRASALRDVGLIDPRYFFTWEDVDLCARLRQRGWKLAVAERSRVWHRWGGTVPAVSEKRMEEHAAGLVLFMRTHSEAPWLTTLPMLCWYALTALRRGDVALWRAAWRGWRRGWST